MSAPLRLRHDDAGAATPLVRPSDARAADSISGWLDVLTRMLPGGQAVDVREELEGHMRERVRDLVLAGQEEGAACRAAIAELGDAAAVAQRFREAGRVPKRRLVMHFAVLGVAGAALVTSLVGVLRPGDGAAQPESRSPEAQIALEGQAVRIGEGISWQLGGELRSLGDRSLRGFEFQPADRAGHEPGVPELKVEGTVLKDTLEFLASSIGASLVVRWNSLGEVGIAADTGVEASAPAGSLSGAFEAINSALAENSMQPVIDFRLRNGVLEVARPDWFDRREATLVRYDLSPLEEQGIATDQFMAVVRQFVSPSDWVDNGGALAEFNVLGRFAFVKGPPRIHDGVRWFLSQFTEGEQPAAGPGAKAGDGVDDVVRVYPIQHTDAQDLLKVLMSMESIKEVDFTSWVSDSRTNSILGKSPPKHHRMVERAIRDLDTAEAALKRRVGQKNREMQAHTRAELAQLSADRAALEEQLRNAGAGWDDAARQTVEQKLREAKDREAEAETRLRVLEQQDPIGGVRRSEAAPTDPQIIDPFGQPLVQWQPGYADLALRADPAFRAELAPRAAVHLDLVPQIDFARRAIVIESVLQLAPEREPITRALLLSHADAETIAGLVRAVAERAEEPGLCIEADPAHNTVIIRGPKDRVLAAEEAVWKLDALAGALPKKGA